MRQKSSVASPVQNHSDYAVSGDGSLFILTPLTEDARTNLEAGVSDEAQWFAGGVAVEHRYIGPLVEQLRNEGWSVQ
jgi:hypothetical protein